MAKSDYLLWRRVDQVRRFERIYESHQRKRRRAVATEDFTIADMRVVNELGFAGGGANGAWLAWRLDLDTGYVCRILKKLEAYDLALSRNSHHDRRTREWELTSGGRDLAATIEDEHRDRAREALNRLAPDDQRRLVDAMAAIEEILTRAAMRCVLGG